MGFWEVIGLGASMLGTLVLMAIGILALVFVISDIIKDKLGYNKEIDYKIEWGFLALVFFTSIILFTTGYFMSTITSNILFIILFIIGIILTILHAINYHKKYAELKIKNSGIKYYVKHSKLEDDITDIKKQLNKLILDKHLDIVSKKSLKLTISMINNLTLDLGKLTVKIFEYEGLMEEAKSCYEEDELKEDFDSTKLKEYKEVSAKLIKSIGVYVKKAKDLIKKAEKNIAFVESEEEKEKTRKKEEIRKKNDEIKKEQEKIENEKKKKEVKRRLLKFKNETAIDIEKIKEVEDITETEKKKSEAKKKLDDRQT
jgi:uncharacterized membrane protein